MVAKSACQRFKIKVGVFLIIYENDRVLLSRRFNTGIADGCHVLPMGGLEEGETATEALIREAEEEVGIVLAPHQVEVAHVMHRLHHLPDGSSFPQMDLFFISKGYSGEISNREPHKCDELKFYPLDALPTTIDPFITQALRCIERGQFYSEIGWKGASIAESLSPDIYHWEAPHYDIHRKADREILKGILSQLKCGPNARVLDIGCGSGNYTIALSQKGLNVEGMDLSSSMLEQAQAKAPHMRWSQGDMKALPYEENSIDGALTINTLHYVRHSLVQVFKEVHRVLKNGGTFVLFAVTVDQCLQFWLGDYFKFFHELGKEILPTRDELIKALEEAQFTDIQFEPFFVSETTEDIYSYACKYRPHLFLDPSIRASMTPLQLPEYAEEVRMGCEKLERDIRSGAIYRVIAQHESLLGEGSFISARKS